MANYTREKTTMVDKHSQDFGTTALGEVKILPPKCKDDVEYLMATLRQANEIIDAIKKDTASKTKKLAKIAEQAEKALLDYYIDSLAQDAEYKEEFDNGKFNKRTTDSWVWEDEDKIVAQLEVLNPSLIRVKKEIDKVNFKKQFTVADDGTVLSDVFEEVDGVRVERKTSYSVTV